MSILALLFTATVVLFREHFTLSRLAEHELWLREMGSQHPIVAYAVALLLYVMITGMSVPGSAVLSIAYGWYFGFLGAVILLSFASTGGATVAFLMSRYLFRDVFQARFADRLPRLNEALEREGAFYLFALRLTPVVPFVLINSVMGLTSMPTRTFWWVSQLGMLPGTIVYAYAGSSAPSLSVIAQEGLKGFPFFEMLTAICLLGTFPIITRYLVRLILKRPKRVAE